MNALNIVLTSVLSVLVFCIGLYFIVKEYIKKFAANKAKDFELLNDYAHQGKIVFLGDSLTDFYPIQEFFPDLDIYNRGIAGDTTKDVENRLANVLELNPEKLFLQIGINDFTKKSLDPKQLRDRILHIANAFDKEKVHIYILSLYPVNRKILRFTWTFRNKARNEKLQVINQMLEDACKNLGYTFIDVYNHLVDEENNLKRDYTLEGLHLSIKGYKVITEVLKPYLINEEE